MGKVPAEVLWTSSPCLSTIRNELCGRECHGVLDLGASPGGLMEFYSSLCSKTHVMDLFSSIAEVEAPPGESFKEQIPKAQDGFDLVTAWDIPNYLTPDRIVELGAHLAERMPGKGLLYFVIGCVQQIPRAPWRFALTENDQLLWERSTAETTQAPQYLTGELLELFPGFQRLRSCLLSNGYQEYLLVRR